MGEIEVTFRVRFPDGDDGDRARERLPRAIAQSHDRLCTVSRSVQLGTPIAHARGLSGAAVEPDPALAAVKTYNYLRIALAALVLLLYTAVVAGVVGRRPLPAALDQRLLLHAGARRPHRRARRRWASAWWR